MELAVGIAASSSTQIALFVSPILVLFSAGLGRPLDLAFEIFELVAIIVAVAVANMVSSDGDGNWYEGVLSSSSMRSWPSAFIFILRWYRRTREPPAGKPISRQRLLIPMPDFWGPCHPRFPRRG